MDSDPDFDFSDSLNDDLPEGEEGGDPAAPPAPKPRFRCAGFRRKDEDGKPLCTYKAHYKWRGPCPGNPALSDGPAGAREVVAARAANLGCGEGFDCDAMRGDGKPGVTAATAADTKERPRFSTGIVEMDHVLGGGLILGNTILLGGSPSAGKSTLTTQIAGHFATPRRPVLCNTSEGNDDDLRDVARRTKVTNPNVHFFGGKADADEVVEKAKDIKAKLVIVDSAAMGTREDSDAPEGSVSMVNTVSTLYQTFGKDCGVAIILIMHVNSKGEYAGGMKVRHVGDVSIYLNKFNEKDNPLLDSYGNIVDGCDFVRELSIFEGKTRQGPPDAKAYLEMARDGSGLHSLSFDLRRKLSKL